MTANELSRPLTDSLRDLGYLNSPGLVDSTGVQDSTGRGYLWRDLSRKVGLEAAFFVDGVPLIGFSSERQGDDLASLRKRLWNYGRVPLLINATDESVATYSGHSPGAANRSTLFEDDRGLLAASTRRENVANTLMNAFSRRSIESGRLDAQLVAQIRRETRVDNALLQNLGYLRRGYQEAPAPRRNAFDSLVGGCLMVSYLSDRNILTADHFLELCGFESLNAVLLAGVDAASNLFTGLARHFNGDVFGSVSRESSTVTDDLLISVASLLQGDDLPSGQQSLWPYDFSILPADLVSSVYEQLLEARREQDSAYYTPRSLVDVILDEVVPWAADSPPTVVDLACGSGAFIIEAFRRIVFQESLKADQRLQYEQLKDLLTDHIYGIDLNPAAANIAVFGLYMALLEEVDPPDIWDRVVLPTLIGRNVEVSDAFGDHGLRNRRFDAVVSNPPWTSELTQGAREYLRKAGRVVADQQMAQAFAWLGAEMLEPGGVLGLLMPAKPLLHNRSRSTQEFRRSLFEEVDVRAIIDLSAMRRSLFSHAVAPAAVLVARAKSPTPASPEPDSLIHLAPHPRQLSPSPDSLAVTPEEFRSISKKLAVHRPEIWKVLLWGTTRDLDLIDHIAAKFPTVREIGRERGWEWGQGFQVGGGDINDATHLSGLRIVDAREISPLRLRRTAEAVFSWETLHRPRKRALYRAPLVLIRRTVVNGGLAAVLLDEDAAFNNASVGISGPDSDRHLLLLMACTIVSSLGRYWHFFTSASWGVERDFVELNEFLDFPLAEPNEEQYRELDRLFTRFSSGEASPLDVGQLDRQVLEIYGLSQEDRRRITQQSDLALRRFRDPRGNAAAVSESELVSYGAVIEETLTSTLSDLSIRVRVYTSGSYRTVAVTFLDESLEATSDAEIGRLAIDVDTLMSPSVGPHQGNPTGIVLQPAGFFVDHDTVYILKTSDSDRWSRDAALDDAERILVVLTHGTGDA